MPDWVGPPDLAFFMSGVVIFFREIEPDDVRNTDNVANDQQKQITFKSELIFF